MTGRTAGRARRWVAVVAAAAAVVLALGVAGAVGARPAEAAPVVGRIGNVAGGCLENLDGATVPGNAIRLAACATKPAQQWSRWADGSIRTQSWCADLRGGAVAADTPVVLGACNAASPSQRWTVLADGRLLNQRANRCMQPYRGYIVASNTITIANCSTASAQRWVVPALSTPTPTTTATVPTTTVPPPTTTTTTVPPATTTTTVPPATTTTTVPPATTTTVAPVTTSAAPAASSWDSDFTGSGRSRFLSTPWNVVGATPPTLVASPATPGRQALQVTMPGGGQRNEVEPATGEFGEGTDRWFGLSVFLPADFPTNVVTWQLITQWKNDGTGSPPLEVDVGKGNLWLSGGYGHPAGPKLNAVPISTADTGRRIDLVFHIVFSRDPARGVVDVWRDNVQAVAGYHPPGGTLYPNAAVAPTGSLIDYWKMGLYRDPAIVEPASYTIEQARMGTSYGAVVFR